MRLASGAPLLRTVVSWEPQRGHIHNTYLVLYAAAAAAAATPTMCSHMLLIDAT